MVFSLWIWIFRGNLARLVDEDKRVAIGSLASVGVQKRHGRAEKARRRQRAWWEERRRSARIRDRWRILRRGRGVRCISISVPLMWSVGGVLKQGRLEACWRRVACRRRRPIGGLSLGVCLADWKRWGPLLWNWFVMEVAIEGAVTWWSMGTTLSAVAASG